MNILFLADAVFEDLPGGSRMVAWELAHGLGRRGHSVTFLVAHQGAKAPDEECSADGVRILRYAGAGRALDFMRLGQEACAKLERENESPFDIVHTHFAYAAVGPQRAIPSEVPRVRTFHGPWDEEGWAEESGSGGVVGTLKARVKRALRARVETGSLRGSDHILTLSDCFRKLVLERGIAPDKVSIIPGGTDIVRFQPAADRSLCRQKLGLPTDRRILLSVRRLAARMGLDNLLRALPEIVRRCPDVLLLLGGTGPEKAHLEGLIVTLGLKDHVKMLGFIPNEQLPTYYQAADLFVLPTLALEGFGLVTTEALSSGLPVIGTPAGATPEILSRLDSRLVTSGTTPDDLAKAILGFLEGDWADSLTPERLHAYVAEHYTWDKHVTATEAVYEKARAAAASK